MNNGSDRPSWLAQAAARVVGAAAGAAAGAESACADAARVTRFLRGRLEFVPRERDIFVVTYPRSGTTWVQYLLHLIRSGGETSFDHISEVTPWWERSLAVGRHKAADFATLDDPRIFKSHLPFRWLPSRGRCVYVVRDGKDVAHSYFHLYRSHLGFEGDFEAFFERFLKGELQYRSWFKHVAGWRAVQSHRRVLIVAYEDLKRDFAATTRRMAAFCRLDLSDALLATVMDLCSVDAMRAVQHKFDHLGELAAERKIARGAFIRQGKVGGGADALSAAQASRFAEMEQAAQRWPQVEGRIADFLH